MAAPPEDHNGEDAGDVDVDDGVVNDNVNDNDNDEDDIVRKRSEG